MTYQHPRVNNASERSISIIMDGQLWLALDKIARVKNKSKTELLRPVIKSFVESHRVSTQSDARGDG